MRKAITQLAVIIAIIVLYFPLAVIALILNPFYVIFRGDDK